MAAPSNAAMAAPSNAPDFSDLVSHLALAPGGAFPGLGNEAATTQETAAALKRAIEEMCSVRQPLERLYVYFTALDNQYLSTIRDAARRAGIPEAELNYKMELLPKASRDRIRQAIANPRPVVAFAGANSSGKSSLINVLLGVQLMPTGEGMVTGNACRLRYSSKEDAKISFYRVNDATLSLVKDESLPEISLNDVDIDDLPDILSVVLLRSGARLDTEYWSEKSKSYLEHRSLVPAAANDDDIDEGGDAENQSPAALAAAAERMRWAKTVIDVQYPLELLEPGFEIVDLPGTTQADKPEFQNFLKDFLRIVRPIPVFVFQNPTIADAERACLQLMQECLVSGDVGGINMAAAEMGSPIFLASNYFDLDDIYSIIPQARRKNGLTQDHINSFSLKRYQLVKTSPLVQGMFPLPMPDDLTECHSIGFISCRDVILIDRKSEIDKKLTSTIFSKFVSRFFAYIASAYRSQLLNATSLLLYAAEVFLSVINAKPSEMQSFKEEAASARAFVKQVQDEVKEKVERDYLLAAYGTIQARAKDPRTILAARQLAAITPIPEDRRNMFHEDKAVRSMLAAMKAWITDEVYLPALTTLNKNVATFLAETLHRRITELPRPNRILDAAASSVLGWEFLKQEELTTTRRASPEIPGWMIAAGVAFLPITLPLTLAIGIISLPFVLAGVTIRTLVKKIDADWKMRQVEDMLHAIGSSSDSIDTNACGQIILTKIEEEIERRVQLYTLITKLQHELHVPFNKVLMPKFTSLGAYALSLRTILIHGAKSLPTASDVEPQKCIGTGGFGKVYECQWNGLPHVLKLPNPGIDISREVMYSHLLSSSAPLGFAELKGVLFINGRLCMILPRYDSDLRTWLVDNVDQLTHVKSAKMLLDIAKALDSLHRLGFIHRDIKLENILVRRKRDPNIIGEEWEVVLADFGISIKAEAARTPIGTPSYMAPEIKNPDAPYDKFVDVWAFGVLMWEILPKSVMARPSSRVKRPLPLGPSTPKILVDLHNLCLQKNPARRCDFGYIVNELQNYIASVPLPVAITHHQITQLCFVCMSNPPNQRLKPCNHTGMCGDCSQTLIVLGRTCPLCRAPIEASNDTITGL
jgi:energy-coupling factor transporter ATP-binding protein EcfA2